MNRLDFLTRALNAEAWAITPQALDNIQQLLASRQPLEADSAAPALMAAERIPMIGRSGKQVAVANLHGTIVSRAPAWAASYGYVSPQAFAAEIRALADDAGVASIAVSCDSPGGTVKGTVEAAEAVAYARSKKRVVFVVNDSACSGAYWLASQASEIVVTPTALTGSIGVFISHMDMSAYLGQLGVVVTYVRSAVRKALGQPEEALSAQARADLQEMVDAVHVQFVSAIAKGRRKPRKMVTEDWATGQLWTGQGAVAAGLADRVGSLRDVLAELTGSATPPVLKETDSTDPEADDLDARASPESTASSGPPAVQNEAPTEDPPAITEAGVSIPDSAPQAQEEQPMKIQDILAKVQAGQALSAEERTALNAHLDGQPAPAANVDLSQLSAEARAIVESAQAEAATARQEAQTAQATANTERDSRLNREFAERAVALGQPAALGATLRSASEKMTAEEYTVLEQSLNAKGAQEGLLGESGSSRDNRESGNVKADYAARVDAAIKADPKLSRAQAGQQVMKADPQFAARYNAGR